MAGWAHCDEPLHDASWRWIVVRGMTGVGVLRCKHRGNGLDFVEYKRIHILTTTTFMHHDLQCRGASQCALF